ncbi:MAG: 1-(5-phosphoribosyl)-5-[(5-phosphoribosylamino)methylideneamino]imidazole-4-carboxamide isomerase, partial [Chitinophagaceae bacterium]
MSIHATENFVIPAIDIIGGKAVRLTQGDYGKKTVYHEDPVEIAKSFEGAGLQRLHLVDLDGAKAGIIQNIAVLEKIAAATRLKIDFGGGVKSHQDVENVISAGAAMVTVGSLAVTQPQLLQEWL